MKIKENYYPSESWERTLLSPKAKLREAIECLNDTGLQIVVVISEIGKLLGTVTDGDIRRGLLGGITLDESLELVINVNPLTVNSSLSREKVLDVMTKNKVHQIPVVNEQMQIVGLQCLDDLLAVPRIDNMMVIMAGGLGTRLHPLTQNCPKPMLPVRGKPMLEHIIERAAAQGFFKFKLAVNHLADLIINHFEDGKKWNIEISYLHEEIPLGTAGAISLMKPSPDESIVVTNGDVITSIRYDEFLRFHEQQKSISTMAVRQYEWQHPFGVIETNGIEVIGLVEKPKYTSLINAGVYVLNPKSLNYLQRNQRCDMTELIERQIKSGEKISAYPIHESWMDLGEIHQYDLINR